MNKYLASWGILLAVCGVVTHFLLVALNAEAFFMAIYYIPPAQTVAYGILAAGALLVVASFFVDWPRYFVLSNETVARYFARVTLVNALAAVAFTAPMLVPPLEMPILLTEWPGIYIVVAYLSFLVFGVVGMLCWSVMYRSSPAYFSRAAFDGRSVTLQLILSEVGVYAESTVLFLAGFTGATLVHNSSVGSVFVGASMEFADIPTAISIFGMMVSVVLGVFTILTGKAEMGRSAAAVEVPSARPEVARMRPHEGRGDTRRPGPREQVDHPPFEGTLIAGCREKGLKSKARPTGHALRARVGRQGEPRRGHGERHPPGSELHRHLR